MFGIRCVGRVGVSLGWGRRERRGGERERERERGREENDEEGEGIYRSTTPNPTLYPKLSNR
jgi:hypothetical protein